MGDAKHGALQKLDLWRALHDNGIRRNRADLVRVQVVANCEDHLTAWRTGGLDNDAEHPLGPVL